MIGLVAALVVLAAPPDDGGMSVELLSKAQIAAVIKRHHVKIVQCYERALVRKPKLQGKVIVTFIIGGDGKVTSAKPGASELPAEVVDCIVGHVAKFEFPPPQGGGTVVVNYPWIFSPS